MERVPDPSLHVRLFGGFDVRAAGRPVVVESHRARSLLAFLALHRGRPEPRQRLAFLLWPDSTEAQARTNLRKVIHRLRREAPELDAYLEATGSTLCWRSDLAQHVDVAAFESALVTADSQPVGSREAEAALRQAVGLYRGDLLAGCYDEWVVEPRERLRDGYVTALRRLVESLVDNGEHVDAVAVGRELVRADPLREDSYRQLMRAHDAAGDPAAAVRVFHECVSTLQRDLGVEPSPATVALYHALARRPPGTPTDAARSQPPAMVGRDREWDRVAAAWLGAEACNPVLLLVTGEAGIGKTRLVDELSAWCARRGGLVAEGRSYPAEGELAYGVAAAWLQTDAFRPVLDDANPADRRALGAVLPGVGPAHDSMSDPAEARRRLFDAVARLIRTAGKPALLVADDAAWCDASTLELVHYLVRLQPPLPLLVAATARSEDLTPDHALRQAVVDLELVDRALEVRLDRLSPAETEALVAELVGRSVTHDEAVTLYDDSEGNPLFVVELVRAGRLGTAVTHGHLPRKLQALIESRLSRLSPPARGVLATTATIGRAFTTALVRDASPASDGAVAAALDELWRRGVIREQAGDAYDFSHASLRDVAYGALSPATRRANHVAVAEALQRLSPDQADTASVQVAGHYLAAGRCSDAIAWYLRAANRAQRLFADAEAVQLLERARALLDDLPPDERAPAELAVLTALPAALVAVDGFASERLAAVQQRALQLADQLASDPDPVLLRSLVMSRLCTRDFTGARDAALRLRGAATGGDRALAVESDYLLGITAFWDGQLQPARECFERVVARFEPARRGEHLVRFGHDPAVVCSARLANTRWFLGDDDGARRLRDGAVRAARDVGHPYSTGAALVFAMLVSIDLADIGAVRDCVRALRSEDQLSRPTRLVAEAAVGYLQVLDGNTGGGLRRMHEAVARAGDVDPAPGWHACLHRLLVAAHEASGDGIRGLAATDAALRSTGSRLWEPEIRCARAVFLAELGHPAATVAAEIDRAIEAAGRQGAGRTGRRIDHTRSRLGIGSSARARRGTLAERSAAHSRVR